MRRLIAILAGISMLAAACSTAAIEEPDDTPTTRPPSIVGSAFRIFESCDDLLAYYQTNAIELVGPYGLDGWPHFYAVDDVMEAAADGGSDTAAPGTTAARVSGTNVQVSGVDEADIVKTDGSRIFTLTDGTLRVITLTSTGAELRGKLQLDWWPQTMLLEGNTILLIGGVWGGGPRFGVAEVSEDVIGPDYYGSQVVRLVQVDVSNPDRLTVEATLDMDGSYVDARLVDGIVRLAINSYPVGITWKYPDGSGIRAERAATEANKQIIRETTLDNWLPYYVYTEGGTEREGRLLDCRNVMAPNEFAGLNTLSLLTFDLREGLGEWADAGVVASGATMYATADTVYLSTQRWVNWRLIEPAEAADEADRFRSQIHMFDTSDPGAPRYLASGDVPGFLLNQFAMDEFDGKLRVATTSQNEWWTTEESVSQVTILSRNGDQLEEIGSVGDLGRGERIFSVRFMGEMGYVVTFRQTDPLYVLDLSDPTDPKSTGELKINGYSAYLHPVGPGKILGLGQDATDQGRVTGTQLSLFDVSDPTNPTRIDQVTMDGGWSAVESTHHAFTFIDGLVLAPYESWSWEEIDGEEGGRFDTGVIAVKVSESSLELMDILRPVLDGPISEKDAWTDGRDPWRMVPQRTVVIGDRIFTITWGGVAIHDFNTFQRLDLLTF